MHTVRRSRREGADAADGECGCGSFGAGKLGNGGKRATTPLQYQIGMCAPQRQTTSFLSNVMEHELFSRGEAGLSGLSHQPVIAALLSRRKRALSNLKQLIVIKLLNHTQLLTQWAW